MARPEDPGGGPFPAPKAGCELVTGILTVRPARTSWSAAKVRFVLSRPERSAIVVFGANVFVVKVCTIPGAKM